MSDKQQCEDAWAILFDDQDMPPEVFIGEGAAEAAKERYAALQNNWSVVLLRNVATVESELAAVREERDRLKSCPDCNGFGIERSGVCHCGEEMDSDGPFAHSGHGAVEMTRPCETCLARLRSIEEAARGIKGHATECRKHLHEWPSCNCGFDALQKALGEK